MSIDSGFTLSSWEVASDCSRKGPRRSLSGSSKPGRPAPASLSTSTSQQVSPHSDRSPPAKNDPGGPSRTLAPARTTRCRGSLGYGVGEAAQVVHEQVRLLHGGEVAASIEL